MKKIIIFVVAGVIPLAGCLFPKKSYDYRAFFLIYHSDTRGYYQPCG